jgi:hypothetical protein
MASTKWRDQAASAKQLYWIGKLADEKAIGDLSEALLETLADVASEQVITGGQASDLLDVLFAAPRKAKPSAGFAPLVSDLAERKAKAAQEKAEAQQARAEAEVAKEAAGGTAHEGYCTKCNHRHGAEKCGASIQYWDDYYPCECAHTEVGTAATQAAAGLVATAIRYEQYATDAAYAVEEIRRGDHVVAFKGRKVPKGTKAQVAKISQGTYGLSAFLILEDGSKAWTALTNIKHAEA